MPKTRTRIAVISGGTSNERAVSLNSGRNVSKYLPRDRFVVSSIEILADGRWLHRQKQLEPADLKPFDLVFIALHGTFGEDGQIQQIFDKLDITYTGSGAAASKLAFDKYRASELAHETGLLIPQQQLLSARDLPDNLPPLAMPLPVVVKPNKSGSSVGVTIVKQQNQLMEALKLAAAEDNEIIIQEYIIGRELTGGILGETPLPVVEIIAATEFFDYEAKYNSTATQEICPAKLTLAQEKLTQQAALQMHRTLGCRGVTRSDFILTPKDQLYYLETNTLPGLTDASLCPKEAQAAGLTFGQFLTKQVELALTN